MANSVWSGYVSMGMMNIPIKLFKAADSPTSIEFTQINSVTGNRVRHRKVDEVTGDQVNQEDIVKGYEVSKDNYITFDPNEIDELLPDRSTSINLEGFISANDVPRLMFDAPYYVGSDEVGAKPYKILAEAMQKKGKIAVGKIVMRRQERLCALIPVDGKLMLSTLRWSEQMRQDEVSPAAEVSEEEVALGEQLIDAMPSDIDIHAFTSDFNEQVVDLIQARIEDPEYQPIRVARMEPTNPSELMDLLRATVEEQKKAKGRQA